jgi:hypothetical protein
MGKENTINLEITTATGELVGTIAIEARHIKSVSESFGRTSVEFNGGLIYTSSECRGLRARVHRIMAEDLEAELANEAKPVTAIR